MKDFRMNVLNQGTAQVNALIKSQDAEMVIFETVLLGLAAMFIYTFAMLAGVQETLFQIIK